MKCLDKNTGIKIKMKIVKIFLIAVVIAFFSNPISAFADELDNYIKDTDKSLSEVIPDDAKNLMEQNDISIENSQNVNKLSVSYWINLVKDLVLENIKEPIRLLGEMLIVILSLTIVKSLLEESELDSLISVIGALASVGILYVSLSNCVAIVTETITSASVFMYTYVPIYSSVLAAGGCATSGITYYVIIIAVCEIIGFITKNMLLPFLGFTIAASVAEAINPSLSGINISNALKNVSKWILGFIATIFIGVISIQGILGTATDTLSSRAIKFAASSFIPIVGGAMSEAYSTFYGSVSFIRSGIGAVGIVIILFTVLSPAISVLCLKLVFSVAKGISAFFGQNSVSALLSGINSVLTIVLGIIACFTIVFIIATAVMMMLSINMV